MNKFLLFLILSIPIIAYSWRTLFKINSHGFFRFFCFECIIWLLVSNYRYWFTDPFSLHQIFSWIFLIISGYLAIMGIIKLKKAGNPDKSNRNEKTLYHFEKTTELVDNGIYGYIRHPLYSSLLFLTWGIFLKNIMFELLIVSVISTIFIYLMALCDEKECTDYFGKKYIDYMKKTKRFVPYII